MDTVNHSLRSVYEGLQVLATGLITTREARTFNLYRQACGDGNKWLGMIKHGSDMKEVRLADAAYVAAVDKTKRRVFLTCRNPGSARDFHSPVGYGNGDGRPQNRYLSLLKCSYSASGEHVESCDG